MSEPELWNSQAHGHITSGRQYGDGLTPTVTNHPGSTADIGFSGLNVFLTVPDEEARQWASDLQGMFPGASYADQARLLRDHLARLGYRPFLDTGPGGQARYNLTRQAVVVLADPGNGIRAVEATPETRKVAVAASDPVAVAIADSEPFEADSGLLTDSGQLVVWLLVVAAVWLILRRVA